MTLRIRKTDVDTPTDAQKEAGNYRKAHIRLHGLDISIENPKGSTRSGKDASGKKWSNKLHHHYGYIRRTKGKDGDHVDVFIGPHPDEPVAFVVDQVSPETGEFDEHKVLLGFKTAEDAEKGYLANYEKDWKGLGALRCVPIAAFKEWLKKGSQRKPFKEWFSIDKLLAMLRKKKREHSLIAAALILTCDGGTK